jgi:hypothetical protein
MIPVDVDDIHSLTDFQRRTKIHLDRLKKTGQPQILTVNGKAEVVVQDARAYQRSFELLDRAEAIEGIRRGLASMESSEGEPVDKAFADIRKRRSKPKKR